MKATKPQIYLLGSPHEPVAEYWSDEHLVEQTPVLISVLLAARVDKHPLKNNVVTRWVGGASEYNFLYKLVTNLVKELEFRFGKESSDVLWWGISNLEKPVRPTHPKRWLQLLENTIPGDAITAYRVYYLKTQQGASWTKRGKPSWFSGREQVTFDF